MARVFSHLVQIYYEDTDHSGVVYHANYLKYMERAREHAIGVPELTRMAREDGVGFVVYHVELTYKEGAEHGDTLDVRTSVQSSTAYRVVFRQDVYREAGEKPLVEGMVHLVCVDRERKLVPLPESVLSALMG